MIIRNENSLIGDFIGTIPAMIELSKTELQLGVICAGSVAELLCMIPRKYNIKRVSDKPYCKSFDLHAAFALADGEKKLHMIQANYHFMGLPIPKNIPRPELEVAPYFVETFDYILSPFSNSLPNEQLWQQDKWQQLVDLLSYKKFCLIGGSNDNHYFVKGHNVTPLFNHSLTYISNVMKQSKNGLISVVTGTSHLAYALGVKNYLFFDQGLWGQNPEAVLLGRNIQGITVEDVIKKINVS